MDGTIRVLIVDDEPLARDGLRLRLEAAPDIEIVGEAGDGPAAVQAIQSLRPDLVYLDVQMPGMDGLEVVERASATHLPLVVFVTAHDRYALRAFELHALDYLLKPFSQKRFVESLNRARAQLASAWAPDYPKRVAGLLASRHGERMPGETDGGEPPAPDGAPIRRLVVKRGERFLLLPVGRIDWFESAANYVRLHTGGTAYLVRMTMAELERGLDATRFARIHRSTIVNIDRIAEIQPLLHGDFEVLLRGGKKLRMSRGYRSRLLP